mgnify:CR=1 FL=1
MKHGPVDFLFCDEDHYKVWQAYRFDPRAYAVLRTGPAERTAERMNGRASTEEFLKHLDEDVGARSCRRPKPVN